MAGLYMIRASAPRGWTLRSVYLDGRDVTDQPIEVRSENVTGLNVIFSDKISSLGGTVRDTRGNPVGDIAVIVFPSDERLWSPQSRQIAMSRTDAAGAYKLSTIPPGDYLVVAVDDVESGEWFDPTFLEQIRNQRDEGPDRGRRSANAGPQGPVDVAASAAPFLTVSQMRKREHGQRRDKRSGKQPQRPCTESTGCPARP